MDGNSSYPKNRQNGSLGVNKMGKNIRKSPLHQPDYGNPKQQQQIHGPVQQNLHNPQPQPQVYNISKSDFRSIVQQLTGTPTRDPFPSSPPPPRPPFSNPSKAPSMRLQRIRPPPLTPIARPPPIPSSNPSNNPIAYPNPHPNPISNSFSRPGLQPANFSPLFPPTPPGNPFWGASNTAVSPVSAYMRYLENSIHNTNGSQQNQLPSSQLQSSQSQRGPPRPLSSGLLPTPPALPAVPSPRGIGPLPPMSSLPSPNSQFALPSPSAFVNLLSPQSPYQSLPPRFQYPKPLSPSFSFSTFAQSGILGPGPQPSPSAGLLFPPSPTGFLPIMSPRWNDL